MKEKEYIPAIVKDSEFRALAKFRFHIRRYLEFSDRAAKAAGLNPKQYQLLLTIKGLPEDLEPTVGVLAEQLGIRHHSTVELVNRAEQNDLVKRSRVGTYVLVALTKKGERMLASAVAVRLEELRVAAPNLVRALRQLVHTRR